MSDKAMATLPFINEAQIEAVLNWGPLMDVVAAKLAYDLVVN